MEIINYPNYLIYDDGRVWSKTSNRFLKPRLTGKKEKQYYAVNLTGKSINIHRLIALHYIPNPENKPYIDHIDSNSLNNNIENLRWATNIENGRNCKIYKNNTSGFKGVKLDKRTGKWISRIVINNKFCSIGYCETAEEASAIYEAKAREVFGEFYREIV